MSTSLFFLLAETNASSGIEIMPDLTLLAFQVVPFLAMMGILTALLFKPMVKYLEDREQATVGAHEKASALDAEADGKLDDYEARLAAAKVEILDYRAKIRTEANAERDTAIGDARGECEAQLAEAVQAIRAEREIASQELKRLSTALAEDITGAVLGRQVEA
ncbi:MAG TPA: ATP synthase F0 subunit B [Myxococcota bacterium]|nr:ATP synthase F0 subunit B [Myxococcota bacterium]